MSNIVIERITDPETFYSLREVWSQLLTQSGDDNIFLTWEWLYSWWKYFGENKKLNLLLIKKDDQIVGIAPLMQTKYGFWPFQIRILENICSTECDYSGVIIPVFEEESTVALLNYLKNTMYDDDTLFLFSNIPEDSKFFLRLKEQSSKFSADVATFKRIITKCPYIHLPANKNDFYQTASKRLNKKLENISKNPDIKFESWSKRENLEIELQILFNLHEKRWKKARIESIFVNPRMKEFFREISNLFAEKGWMHLSFIKVKGKEISAAYGFIYKKIYYELVCAFDPELSMISPGNLHKRFLIDYLIEAKLNRFDFLRGEEAFKYTWTNSARSNWQFFLVKRNLIANLKIRSLIILLRIKEVKQRKFKQNYFLLLERIKQAKLFKERVSKNS